MLDPRSLAERTEVSPRLPEGTDERFAGYGAVQWDVTLAAPRTIRAMNAMAHAMPEVEPLDPARHRRATHAEDEVARTEES